MRKFIVIINILLFFCNCTRIHQPNTDEILSVGVQTTIERAKSLANLSFIPCSDLECNNGYIYKKDVMAIGAPYSSVKEIQTFIGHDVSFYTFLTAVNNFNSLLYTEKIDYDPYHGTNCKLYYGVVCSSAIMYALGIDIPFNTYLFNVDSDLFLESKKQSPDAINLCSILLEPGHISMVVGIKKDQQGNIISVDVFEATQMGTIIHEHSYSSFCEYWENHNIVLYEYKYIENNTTLYDYIYDNDLYNIFNSPLSLCPNKGDRSSYSCDDDVIINILDSGYNILELYQYDKKLYETDINNKNEVSYSYLSPGEYSVRMKNSTSYSTFAYFEVIDTQTNITYDKDKIIIEPKSNNAIPVFISLNSIPSGGYKKYYPFKETIDAISIPYPETNDNPMYLRIVYRGKYGRVMYQEIIQNLESSK